MLFYHPDCDLRFSEYGIEIPIVDERAVHVFSALNFFYPKLDFTDLSTITKITKADLERAHNPEFVDRLFGSAEELKQEVYSCYELVNEAGEYERYNPKNQKKDFKELLNTILLQVGMTYSSSKFAIENGFSYFLGGGMHHAMSFGGRGFCLVNDIVITLRKLQAEGLIKTAWIVDVDVHKGDGAAEILKDDTSIKTLSIHMKEGWPLNSGSVKDPWFIPCSVDIGIDNGEEDQYLARLEAGLLEMEERFLKPDIVIVVNGADPYEKDVLPSSSFLNMTKEQLFLRDKMIYDFFTSRKIPQSFVMAGGYGDHAWEIYFQFLKFVWESSSVGTEVSSR
jgi:acetoin utilization deacetylase AcuC-like enzyme